MQHIDKDNLVNEMHFAQSIFLREVLNNDRLSIPFCLSISCKRFWLGRDEESEYNAITNCKAPYMDG